MKKADDDGDEEEGGGSDNGTKFNNVAEVKHFQQQRKHIYMIFVHLRYTYLVVNFFLIRALFVSFIHISSLFFVSISLSRARSFLV